MGLRVESLGFRAWGIVEGLGCGNTVLRLRFPLGLRDYTRGVPYHILISCLSTPLSDQVVPILRP